MSLLLSVHSESKWTIATYGNHIMRTVTTKAPAPVARVILETSSSWESPIDLISYSRTMKTNTSSCALLLLLLFCWIDTLQAMRNVLVTGGNKGIGKAICQRILTEWSDTHVFLAARNPQNGQTAVEDLVNQLGSDIQNRLTCVEMDVANPKSVQKAAKQLEGTKLYGIVNNAGIGWDYDVTEIVNTNYFGPRRVNDAFAKNLQRPGGRIVNIASASGPNYVSSLPDSDPNKELLTKPWKIPGGIAQLDELARSFKTGEGYGISKALLNAYTVLHGKSEKDLIINSCSPGYILTDMTAGRGASAPPSKGAVCPCFLLMDETLAEQPRGRYYGSDCVRSPLDVYRGPGDPPYVSDDDLVELSFEASK